MDYLLKVLRAIADGYPAKGHDDLILVENPDFREENGSDPNLVFLLKDYGWQDIDAAPKNKNVLAWGPRVGKQLVFFDGVQWQKCEMSATYQLGPQALTHYLPIPDTPKIP